MKKVHLFNGLQERRYHITATHNVAHQVNAYNFTYDIASSTWELSMTITYAQLCIELKTHFGIEGGSDSKGSSLQSYRNHLSTLNSFLASVGKTLESRVGVELGSAFDASLRQYLEIVQVAQRTKRDRRNHLRLVQRLHGSLANGNRKSGKPATSLSMELRAAVARFGMPPKTFARQISVSTSAVQRWLGGAMPNKRGIPTLRRLEAALGLPRNHLVNLIDDEVTPDAVAPVAIPFRERLKKLKGEKYRLPESALTPEFVAEWRDLFEYKTTPYTMLERVFNGKWRCIPADTAVRMSPLVCIGDTVCPTAEIFLDRFRTFFGAIRTMSERGTLVLSTHETIPLTLAWLAYPKALDAFLKWITRRSGGLMHNGQKGFCSSIKSLLRPTSGYLWQNPQLALRLPESCRPATPEAWRQLCESSHKLASGWLEQSNCLSRDPALPIAGLLELEQPLKPVLTAIELIERAANAAPSGGLSEALLRRDALLLAMLLSNPLRKRTMASLQWLQNGAGTLQGNAVSGWRLRLQAHHMKNGKGLYDVRVSDWVAPRLEAYLEEYRETILGDKKSPYLFVTSGESMRWDGMGAHIRKLTQRYIKGCPGFGPQAFRHLVATDWLTQHPNDYLTVAELLNDKLDTVMENYAHLKRDTSFLRYEDHLSSML